MNECIYLDRNESNQFVWRRLDDGRVVHVVEKHELYRANGDFGLRDLESEGYQHDMNTIDEELKQYIIGACSEQMPFCALFEDIRYQLTKQWKWKSGKDCPVSDVPQIETEYKETGMDDEIREGLKSAVYIKNTEDDPKEPKRKIKWKDNPEGYTKDEKRRQMKVARKFVYAAYRVLLEIAGEDELEADDASPLSEAIADLAIARANLAEAHKEIEND